MVAVAKKEGKKKEREAKRWLPRLYSKASYNP